MKRVLFVDDEAKVLAALRRMLWSRRSEWDMAFSTSAEEGLDLLAAQPFDVVVSDMRMPGLDGAAFLSRVQDEFPGTVRLILSGYSERDVAVQALSSAHYFLTKPCDPAELQETIDRALRYEALLGDPCIRSVLGDPEALPAAPAVYQKLVRALTEDEAGVTEVAKIIEEDAAICSHVLRLVNAGFFAFPRQISSVMTAVSLMGVGMLRYFVLSAEVFGSFRGLRTAGIDLEATQAHAMSVAHLARRLAGRVDWADEAFMAGMLHDIGKLVLASQLPDGYRGVVTAQQASGQPAHEVELELLGTTHAKVGAYVMGLWSLPTRVVEAVAYHHSPQEMNTPTVQAHHVVWAANLLVHELRSGEHESSALEDGLAGLALPDGAQLAPAWRELAAEALAAV